MRQILPSLLIGGLLATSLASVRAQDGPTPPPLGMSVYADANYRGRNATFIDDMPDLSQTGLDRRISSIVVAQGEVWQVCTDPDFLGRCQVFSGTESNLQLNDWNDMIRSARRVQGGGRGGRGGRGGGFGPERGTIELFAGTRFSGQRQVVDQAESNLRRVDFNDRASSLRVAQGETWEVCVNANYDDCRIVDEDMPELTSIGLNREISSVRPRPGLGGRGRGGARAEMVIYDLANYRGQSQVLTDNAPAIQLTANSAGSVRIISGRWELCTQPKFGGRCVTITNNVPDLSRLSLPGRVSSARPR